MNKDLEYECKAIGKIAHEVISIEYKDKGYVDDKGVFHNDPSLIRPEPEPETELSMPKFQWKANK